MRISKAGIALVKHFEGLYLESYKDPVGVWTIGYGITSADKDITGKEITKGMKITKATAERWLEESLNKKYLPKVLRFQDHYHFDTSQIDALTSFAFNIGSIDQLTRYGNRSKKEIEDALTLYVKAGGKTLKGLVRRREAERDLYRQGPKGFDEGFPLLPDRGYFEEGDKGEPVKKIQRFLTWMDLFDSKIDGVYGKKTIAAVKKLQKMAKTPQNGKFGNKCLPYAKKVKR